MKKFLEEFKAFALKGNVMDMAIGVIIAGAFSTIVASLTENIINPIIGMLFNLDLSKVVIHLTDEVTLGIGAFLSSIINFILLALVLFIMLKAVRKMMEAAKKPEEPKAPEPPKKSDELLALEQIVALLKEKK